MTPSILVTLSTIVHRYTDMWTICMSTCYLEPSTGTLLLIGQLFKGLSWFHLMFLLGHAGQFLSAELFMFITKFRLY